MKLETRNLKLIGVILLMLLGMMGRPASAALSGFTRQQVFNVRGSNQLTNKVLIVRLTPQNFDWAALRSDGGDLRITDASDNLLVFGYDLFDPNDQMAQLRVLLGANPPPQIVVQYGNPSATQRSQDVLSATFQAPTTSSTMLGAWTFSENSGTAYASQVPSGANLNIVGSGYLRLDGTYLNYKAYFLRLAQATVITGADALVGPSTNCFFRSNGTSAYLQADAGFLDSPPTQGTIHFNRWDFGGTSQTVLYKKSDANNYLSITRAGSANTLTVTKCNAGVADTWTSRAVWVGNNDVQLTVSWGNAGFKIYCNGQLCYLNTTDKAAWGAGSGGKFTLLAQDDGGTITGKADGTVGWMYVDGRQWADQEVVMATWYMNSYTVTGVAAKMGAGSVVNDATASYEQGAAQEPVPVVDSSGRLHVYYHASQSGGNNTICHQYSNDWGTTWTRDAGNPLFGDSHGGTSRDIIFIGGGKVATDKLLLTYSDGADGGHYVYGRTIDLKASSFSASLSPEMTLLTRRAGDWPTGVANFDVRFGPRGWIGVFTGGGNNGPAWCGLIMTGSNYRSFTIPASLTLGEQSASPHQTLAPDYVKQFGVGTSSVSSAAFQPSCPVVDAYGYLHCFGSGSLSFDPADGRMTFSFHRMSPDGVHWFDSPWDIIEFARTDLVTGAEQSCNPHLIERLAGGQPLLFTDHVSNVNGTAKLVMYRFNATSVTDLFTETPGVDYQLPQYSSVSSPSAPSGIHPWLGF